MKDAPGESHPLNARAAIARGDVALGAFWLSRLMEQYGL